MKNRVRTVIGNDSSYLTQVVYFVIMNNKTFKEDLHQEVSEKNCQHGDGGGKRNYSLRAGRSGDRFPATARFSAPILTGRGAQPAPCIMCTGSVPEVKRPGFGVDHSPPPSTEVKERVQLYPYSPLDLHSLF
jgi:hypothetical protein